MTWGRSYCSGVGDGGNGSSASSENMDLNGSEEGVTLFENNPQRLDGEAYIKEYCIRAKLSLLASRYVTEMFMALEELQAKGVDLEAHPSDVPPLQTNVEDFTDAQLQEIEVELDAKFAPGTGLSLEDFSRNRLPPKA